MSLDINRLLDQMDDARDATLNLIDKFKKISDLARDFGGTISETVPTQIQKDIDIITEITDGTAQNSLSSLIELIENVPVGQVRTRRAVRTTLNPAAQTQATPVIDTTPDISGGAQSAVAAAAATPAATTNSVVESVETPSSALSDYLKAGRIKEMQAKRIANRINLGETLEGIQNDSPYGRSMNELVGPDLHYNLDKVLEGAGSGTQEIGNAFDVSLKSNMAKMRESVKRMHDGEKAEETPNWRKAAQSVHMNESLNGFDGMFGGARRMKDSVSNISFDKMFEGGVVNGYEAVHVVDNLWNDNSVQVNV